MKIAGLDCINPWFLAPMHDVTNLPFRALCREQGAGLVMTEMLSSVDLARAHKRTLALMEFEAGEAPVGVQISGVDDLDVMERAARRVQEHGASLLNLNCGCPVKKVIRGGSGSALLKDVQLLRGITRRLRAAVSIPLTIKLRAGWDGRHVNAIDVGLMAQEEGVDAIMIHARTRAQGYEGSADWQLIADLKAALAIPVIGNGDVFAPQDALRMLETTGCDGVMIGRGAMGNPWLFRGLVQAQRGDTAAWRPNAGELIDTVQRHFDRYVAWIGEHRACLQFRKQLLWYTHRLEGSRPLREALRDLHTVADFARIWGHFARQLEAGERVQVADVGRADFKPSVGGKRAA